MPPIASANIIAAAERVRSSAFGHLCEYVLRVPVADLWPIARCTGGVEMPEVAQAVRDASIHLRLAPQVADRVLM
jgi:hypothetical protein